MDYRRIQITGESTYIISLPKKWVRKNNISKGDTLLIEEEGDGILIKPRDKKDKFIEIDVKDRNVDFLSRLLITRYIKGYDIITFKSENFIEPEKRKCLKDTSNLLIGMEPFGETSREIMFKMLMQEGIDLISTISRMHEMSFLSLRDIIDGIRNPNHLDNNLLRSIIEGNNEIDKFYFLILRQLSDTCSSDIIAWIQIVSGIERISDHIEDISHILLENKDGKFSDMSKNMYIYEPLIELYGKVMLSLRSGHLEMADEVIRGAEDLIVKGGEVLCDINDRSILIHKGFTKIGEHISNIAEGVINLH